MNKEELIEFAEEKENLLKKTEIVYTQLQGQIILLRDLIKREDNKKEEIKVE